jgi:hypothetical protein
MATRSPAHNGALGMALDAWRDDLGLSLTDLADRTDIDEKDLHRLLSGHTPVAAGHQSKCLRALADVIEFQTTVAASA